MALEPGTRFGSFKVTETIGSGGMGEVCRATDTNLKRDVALKVLPEGFVEDAARLARFRREAEILASLNHPNIAAVYGLEKAHGQTAIVMELVEGPTLADRIRLGPIPVAEATDIAIQISNAIEAAHERGVVHRDLKPENIKLRDDGVVKVLDFGIAKTAERAVASGDSDSPPLTTPALTETGMILGTAAYMSPEQARGRALDTRTDIWAFGAIVYEMLSGQAPFLGEDVTETIANVLRLEPDWNALPELPPLLLIFIRQCLKKDPRDRVRDIADVRLALMNRYDAPLFAAQRQRNGKRLDSSIWLASALIVLVAGALGAALWNTATGPASVELTFRQLTFRNGDVGMARFAPDGQVIVYSASWDGAPYQIYTTRTDSFQSSPLANLPPADLLAVSHNSRLALALARQSVDGWQPRGVLAEASLAGGAPRELEDGVVSADFGRDGEIAAVVRLTAMGMQIEFPVGSVVHSTTGGRIINGVRVSPNGEQVCFSVGYGQLYTSTSGGPARQIGGTLPRVNNCAWNPDGSEIWFTYAPTGGTYASLDAIAPSGDRRRVLAALPAYGRLHDVSPEGSVLMAIGPLRYSVHGSASASAIEKDLSVFDATRIEHFNFAGTHLLLRSGSTGSADRGPSWLRALDAEDPVQLGNLNGLALSPDNAWIAALGDGSTAAWIDSLDRRYSASNDGSNVITLEPIGTGMPRTIELPVEVQYRAGNQHGTNNWEVRNPEFSANGERLLLPFARNTHGIEQAYVHDLAQGWTRAVTPEGVTGPVVLAPDGQAVAYQQPDGLYVYSLVSDEHRRLPGDPDSGMLARWSADQASLYLVEQRGAVATIYDRDIETGERTRLREIRVPDPAGVTRFELWVAGDGAAYAYTLDRMLSNLYLVENVD